VSSDVPLPRVLADGAGEPEKKQQEFGAVETRRWWTLKVLMVEVRGR
jgi:hypothetical protein